jgi:hypothetical protein
MQEMREAGFAPIDYPLPTPAEMDEAMSMRPVDPPPTDDEVDAMCREWEARWGDNPPPF